MGPALEHSSPTYRMHVLYRQLSLPLSNKARMFPIYHLVYFVDPNLCPPRWESEERPKLHWLDQHSPMEPQSEV